jgi:hypothetical protein
MQFHTRRGLQRTAVSVSRNSRCSFAPALLLCWHARSGDIHFNAHLPIEPDAVRADLQHLAIRFQFAQVHAVAHAQRRGVDGESILLFIQRSGFFFQAGDLLPSFLLFNVSGGFAGIFRWFPFRRQLFQFA